MIQVYISFRMLDPPQDANVSKACASPLASTPWGIKILSMEAALRGLGLGRGGGGIPTCTESIFIFSFAFNWITKVTSAEPNHF